MTPGARIAAAIGVLDAVLAGAPVERNLINWARASRFAGSGDRAAVRDHVFDALRCRRSFGWLGGAETGRGLMIGALRASGADPADQFDGVGHAPPMMNADEKRARNLTDAPRAVRLDLPDWLVPQMDASLGADMAAVAGCLQRRAPVFLRVNMRKTRRAQAADLLASEGIATERHPLSATALRVTRNPRRVRNSTAFRDGLVEFQDAASQALADGLSIASGDRVLDYCAGGGGKSLAIAARVDVSLFAHDTDARRMQDIPARATRAGVDIRVMTPATLRAEAPFDLVLCDVPCSGSGSWRRAPEGKWRLSPGRLQQLGDIQREILACGARLVRPGGTLAYATCSLLRAENSDPVDNFLMANPEWTRGPSHVFSPLAGGDGFFVAELSSPIYNHRMNELIT